MAYKSWYKKDSDDIDLYQGDIIKNVLTVIPPETYKEGEISEAGGVYQDVIILTQSCDLRKANQIIVTVCPIMSLVTLANEYTNFKDDKEKEKMRLGLIPSFCMMQALSRAEYNRKDFQVVNFKEIYTLNKRFLENYVSQNKDKLIHLNLPYRERLSQSFGFYFMRVGIPDECEIPSFDEED